ncbi:truncated hemoglobin YjbI [Saccharothrix tamanrassetensis]|uniref:Truncated hemoglobin YjbI n=1 Tax=Saccharothrix tamanrassetensis TaxID=1051531 RepID=A0A841C979_9PSEU|nr:winged helix DNA-binding domain-containing protein [Saccharothrix tamanrassetensis]MBB5953510.1 truncated hemoglobin YjbI [Saccharothrix tamanrassetensis]
MARHFLTVPGSSPAEVVRAMCGAHAQVMSAAELSIGLRIPGITRQRVRDAIWVDRTLVKTRGPRGTVHLLPTEDLPVWLGAQGRLADRPQLLTAEQTDAVVAAIADALREAELTTEELTDAVVARTGSWAGDRVKDAFQDKWPRWTEAITAATNRGAMCFAPNKGRRTAYTSPQRWLPGVTPKPDGAVDLLHRYLHSYGPATPEHFARWLGAPRRFVDEVFEQADVTEVAGGFVVRGDTEWPDEPPRGVWLLPYFDAFVVGSHPREQLFPGRAWQRALAGGQAGNYPVLLVDGVVAGVWHQRRSGSRIAVTVEPFGELTAAQRRGLDARVERVGEFLEGRPELTVGAVSVGPHA